MKTEIFESKTGRQWKEESNFIIIPSIIGFSDSEFKLKIREEIQYLGMSTEELARLCYMDRNRI